MPACPKGIGFPSVSLRRFWIPPSEGPSTPQGAGDTNRTSCRRCRRRKRLGITGLQILEREKEVFLKNPDIQPDLVDFDYVAGRQLKPEARSDIIGELAKAGIQPTSMIDVSDGLTSDLFHLCTQSKLGAQLFHEKIPIDTQTEKVADAFQIHPMTYATNGGEDYELLFTVALDQYDKIKEVPDVFVIGNMTDDSMGITMVNEIGNTYELEAQGWNHFKTEE